VAVWEVAAKGEALRRARRPFALATVVRRERPASAQPGDQALVTADGRLIGWIGGSCAEPVIIREARAALLRGCPVLVRLGPPEVRSGGLPEGVVGYPMTCHSGGILEVFVDPCLPEPQAVLVGDTPVAEALATMAQAAGFAVIVCGPEAGDGRFAAAKRVLQSLDPGLVTLDPWTFVVVATHGEDDMAALATALRSEAGYVALVASRKRASACLEDLGATGLSPEQLARLKAPAGLDIGAVTPAEIAVSILAEMVQQRRSPVARAAAEVGIPPEPPVEATAVDPVCGMTVEIGPATPSHSHQDQTYYFCCPACRGRFERDPQRFLATAPSDTR
jgi:xanthine dehydrogenase accessory factor